MYSVVEGMTQLAKELGVTFHLNETVEKIIVENKKAVGIISNGKRYNADVVISGADYHHSETLLKPQYRL